MEYNCKKHQFVTHKTVSCSSPFNACMLVNAFHLRLLKKEIEGNE